MRPSLFEPHGPAIDWPVLGHIPAMRADPLRTLTTLAREHGGLAPIRFGPLDGYVVSEPALLEQIFVSKRKLYTRKTRVYEALAIFLGRGILTTEGEDWRTHRRIVQPAFHKKRLREMTEGIVRISDEGLARWADRRGDFDASEAMTRLTLRIVSEVLLGTKTDAVATEIGESVAEAQRWVEEVIGSLGALVPGWLPSPRNRTRDRLRATLDRIAYGIIEERERSGERGSDVLSMLLDARYEDGRPLPKERIRNELLTLMAAGHETTASGLSWTLMRLSQHPHVARRLEAEVDEVLGGRLPTFEDVPKLEYTRWVFDEVMRLHPPAWTTGRMVVEEHELGGRRMTPGTMVLLTPYVTHRRPDLWENPEGFDPERWETLSKRGALAPFTYFPFGGGTRKCVGEAFAYLEATLVLAMIAQRYRLELVPGDPVVAAPQVTLGLHTGLWMRAVPREAAAVERTTSAALA